VPLATDLDPVIEGLLVFDRTSTVVQLGLLLFIFGFASLMHLTWRHYVLGILLGLAVFTSVEVVLLTAAIHSGAVSSAFYPSLKSAAFNCCVLIWVVYLFSRDRVDAPNRPPRQQLEEWNRTLLEFLQR
jgi:hypothetical protein